MALLDDLTRLLGAENVLTGEDAAPFLIDWRRRYRGRAAAVVRPASTQEVADTVKLCVQHGAPILPLGGNTGLVGGSTPDDSGNTVVISLQRLNRIRNLDTDNDTATVEAGVILQSLQQAARDAGRLFPLSLAAEGSCTIGGNLASNAGGTQVLRYGNMRELTLGLEVVTAEGEIWHGLRGLRKDNTGYDLRDLYIGSEGTLGIITAATLRLYPQPAAQCTALVAIASAEDAVTLLSKARKGFAASLTGFELMSGFSLGLVTQFFPQQVLPLGESPWYALLELSDSEGEAHARERFEAVLGEALETELVQDAVIAESIAQSRALWHLRESIPLAEAEQGKSIKHDVSIPISLIPEFMRVTDAALAERFPGIRQVIFGHLGDGNLHYNVVPPEGVDPEEFLLTQKDVYLLVHDSVHAHHGSISAEHGVGQMKRDELPRYKSQVEMDLMRRIKQALDPKGVMNPGKLL